MLTPDDAVLSDELNHASIIDGIRLCRAKRMRYKHMDLSDLESKLKESQVCGSQTGSSDVSLKCLHCDSQAVFFCSVFNNEIIYVVIRCILNTFLSFLGVLDESTSLR